MTAARHRLAGVLLVSAGLLLTAACGGGGSKSAAPPLAAGSASPSAQNTSSTPAPKPTGSRPTTTGTTAPVTPPTSYAPLGSSYEQCLRNAGITPSNAGALTAAQQAAARKCAPMAQISPSAMISQFQACMARHGVSLTSGNLQTLSPNDPKVAAAIKACEYLMPMS